MAGVAGPENEESGSPKAFFARRFPNALIDEFSFLGGSATKGRLLYGKANILLEQLRSSRARKSSRELPIVFVGHGLGALVVKQALISSTEEPRYRELALYTSTLVLLGAPHRATAESSWEHICLRLVLASNPPPEHCIKLVQRLVVDLDDISARFRTISSSVDLVNLYESSPSKDESNPSRKPLLDTKCSIFGLRDDTGDVPCDCSHDDLWRFVDDKYPAEEVCRRIKATGNGRFSLFNDTLRCA